MSLRRRSVWARYGAAVALVMLILVSRWLLDPTLGENFAIAALFLAILVAAWYGGFGPAAFVSVGGLFAVALFFPHENETDSQNALVGMFFYFAITFGIASLGAAMSAARRTAEASAEQLRITLDSIGDAVLVTDAEGRVVSLNPAAEQLTGWKAQEANDQPLEKVFVFVNERTRETAENPVAKALREGTLVGLSNHSVLISKHGQETAIDNNAAPIRGDNNKVIGAVLVFRDVSQRREAEANLQRLHQQLRDADKRKDEFLAMLAHELRNPLAPIRSGLDLLARVDHEQVESVQIMLEQVEHLARLVDDLLDISRIVRGKVELRREKLPLAQVVNRIVHSVRPSAESREQELVINLDASLWVHGDRVRIAQIVENLLSNALKYTEHGGRIEVSLDRDEDSAVLSVKDNGIGIEPDLLPYVFDLFAQSSRALDRTQGGLGIGLTLAHKLVELHGGSISVRSAGSGHGSEFRVRFPAVEPDVDRTSMPPTIRPVSTARRILLVDDNVSAVKLLSKLIGYLGPHEIETVHDGAVALSCMPEFRPEIVLLDIGLPGMNGYEVCRSIRSDSQFDDVLVVALTGYGQAEDRRRSREAGFDEHLVKPVAVETLLAMFNHRKLQVMM